MKDDEVKAELEQKLCVECMKVYTDFVDKLGNRICSGCDKRKKKEVQKIRRYVANQYWNREFGGLK